MTTQLKDLMSLADNYAQACFELECENQEHGTVDGSSVAAVDESRQWLEDELRRLHAEVERKSDAIQRLWKERDELRAALAEPQEMTPKELAASIKRGEKWKVAENLQEPVAIPITGKLGNTYSFTGNYSLKKGDLLYTAPPQRKPLTDEDEALLRQALEALEYHVEQTRPIHRTSETIAALRERLAPLGNA